MSSTNSFIREGNVEFDNLLKLCERGLGGVKGNERHNSDSECLKPFDYIAEMKGKNVRSQLVDAFQVFFERESTLGSLSDASKKDLNKYINIVKEIVGWFHNASLIVDDIEDDSLLRRGKPCAHKIFGTAQALNSGNYKYFLAMERLKDLPNSGMATDIVLQEILNLHRGQGQEILWRDNVTCPSYTDYVNMILDKTGGLFRMAIGLIFAVDLSFLPDGEKERFKAVFPKFLRLTNLLSVYFQIRDDFINLANPKYFRQKTFCEDLSEGKFSFPIIHGIKKEKEQGKDTLLNIVRQRPGVHEVELKLFAVDLMKTQTESFLYTRGYLNSIKEEIMAELSTLGGHSQLSKILALLAEEVKECDV
eukprot:augustus_masked-scaffold_20-processed-gene-0.13-mRNA-1 protein AED:0.04 eAED:0.04 QI:0/-1/0/1/-1/1/1/0/362